VKHDVFISYSDLDRQTANAICATLEQQGIRCWIAHRDIPAGADWPAAITSALRTCRTLVLVLTPRVNDSQHVRIEVELAVKNGLTIIPVRIEDFQPSASLEYLLSSRHWFDAITPPLQAHVDRLAASIRALLDTATPMGQTAPPPIPPTPVRPVPVTKPSSSRLHPGAIAVLLIVGVFVIGAGLYSVSDGAADSESMALAQDDLPQAPTPLPGDNLAPEHVGTTPEPRRIEADGGRDWVSGRYLVQSLDRLVNRLKNVNNSSRFSFDDDISVLAGLLRNQEAKGFRKPLTAGQRYLFVASGDDDVLDLDVAVYDATGQVVAQDNVLVQRECDT